MRIVHVNAVSGSGSTGRLCEELSSGLEALGHNSSVAFSSGSGAPGDFKFNSSTEVKVHALASRLSGLQGFYSTAGTYRLIEYLQSEAVDIVHLHNVHANCLNLPILARYLAENDIATAITLHDAWLYTGNCTHYSNVGCSRWLDGCGQCPQLKQGNPSWFFDRTEEMLSAKAGWFSAIPRIAVIGVSKWITEEARRSILASASKVTAIYNWVDLETFRPLPGMIRDSPLEVGPGLNVVSVATRWTPGKGLADLTAVASELASRGDSRVHIVGEMSDAQPLPPNVVRVGPVKDRETLASIYRSADVLLSLSREESFGLVIAEAIACGTPAVVMDATGCAELVADNVGYAVRPGDVQEIVRALDCVDVRGKASYREACRSKAVQEFGMRDRIAEYESVYRWLRGLSGAR